MVPSTIPPTLKHSLLNAAEEDSLQERCSELLFLCIEILLIYTLIGDIA